VISKHNGAIASLKIVNRTQDFFDMLVDVEVRDLSHLAEIIAALRASSGVATVERARA
jgi:GTP pyrophosphokinase